MKDINILICETQAEIYALSVELGYNTRVFSDALLKSDFCKRSFDTIYSHFQLEMANECMDFILPEIGNNLVKDEEELNKEKAYFVGYVYRYLYYATGYTSSEILDKVSFDTVAGRYSDKDNKPYAIIAKEICDECGIDIVDRDILNDINK